jgi:hypothetical protein
MREGVLAALLVVSLACVACGTVRRDPVTGKWVEVTGNENFHDPRASAGAGGDDGGVFGGFDFIDSRPKAQASQPLSETPLSLPSLSDIDVPSVRTRELIPRSSKYSRDVPLEAEANIQTASSSASAPAVSSSLIPSVEEMEQMLVQQQSTQAGSSWKPQDIESVVHYIPTDTAAVQIAAQALPTRSIGNLCRFQGNAPLTACPKEAKSGCVDRIPCRRTCKQDGFFNYRCQGPQLVSKAAAIAAAQETPIPRPPSEDYVKALTDKLKNAIQANDYSALARLIVGAQQGRASAAAAASALAQISSAIMPTVEAPTSTNGESDSVNESGPVAVDADSNGSEFGFLANAGSGGAGSVSSVDVVGNRSSEDQ